MNFFEKLKHFFEKKPSAPKELRRYLGNGFYVTYNKAPYSHGSRDVNLCLHNENNPSLHAQITDERGDFLNFPGYIEGEWEKLIKGKFWKFVRYPSDIGAFKDGRAEFRWQVQPDGMYFADESGFGMDDREEIWLRSYFDENGNFTEPFSYVDDEEE